MTEAQLLSKQFLITKTEIADIVKLIKYINNLYHGKKDPPAYTFMSEGICIYNSWHIYCKSINV